MMTMILDDPGATGAWSATTTRVRVVEATATRRPSSSPSTRSTPGIYCFDGGALVDALERITPDNAQGEFYLPTSCR